MGFIELQKRRHPSLRFVKLPRHGWAFALQLCLRLPLIPQRADREFVETIRNQSLIRKPVVAGSRAYQITHTSVTNERANNLCALCQEDSFSVRVSADLL